MEIRSAEFSECGKYRYLLKRVWNDQDPFALCIGLNPSRANHERNDTTINILTDTLRWHEYGGFYMANLYALITPHPKELFSVPDAIKDNDKWIDLAAGQVRDIIFCWGAFKGIEYRAKKMKERFPKALCFGRSANGSPWHPRALPYASIKFNETTLTIF